MDLSFLGFFATFAENNVAAFVLLVLVFIFFKFGYPYFKDCLGVFRSNAGKLDGLKVDIAGLQTDITYLKDSDVRQDKAIQDLSCEQFKKNVYNQSVDYPMADRIANYVRYRRLGGNGDTRKYFQEKILPGNEALVRTLFDAMDFHDPDLVS